MRKAKGSLDIFLLYKKLRKLYGHQHWWPVRYEGGDSLFEISAGAILTQSTSWKNVEKALSCLHHDNLLSAKAVVACPVAKLQRCLRSSGYYRQKAKKLKNFSNWLIKNYNGDLKKFFKRPLKQGREELLSLWGIGPETADSILLYAGRKPIFVVDAYTRRLCQEFGVKFRTYDEYREWFESGLANVIARNPDVRRGDEAISLARGLPRSSRPSRDSLAMTKFYNEFHALIVASGKDGHSRIM